LIGSTVLDACFTDLDRVGEQLARATLSDPSTGRAVTIWMDDHYRYLQVFSGDTLAPDRRRQGLAVEPMTCPPNAFRTGVDVTVLQPDESVTMAWGCRVESS
jgi:aldose 1-epimerase